MTRREVIAPVAGDYVADVSLLGGTNR